MSTAVRRSVIASHVNPAFSQREGGGDWMIVGRDGEGEDRIWRIVKTRSRLWRLYIWRERGWGEVMYALSDDPDHWHEWAEIGDGYPSMRAARRAMWRGRHSLRPVA